MVTDGTSAASLNAARPGGLTCGRWAAPAAFPKESARAAYWACMHVQPKNHETAWSLPGLPSRSVPVERIHAGPTHHS